jgi:hypothetical protein
MALQEGVYRSLNGQITRDTERGRVTIATPRTCVVAGELSADMTAGSFNISSSSPIGAVALQSLDNEPLERSQHYVVKMVTVAENTGQKLSPTPPNAPAPFVLDQPGKAPVLTQGAPSEKATIVKMGDTELVRVGMVQGVWELLVTPHGTRFWCDTAGVSVTFAGKTQLTVAPGQVLDF